MTRRSGTRRGPAGAAVCGDPARGGSSVRVAARGLSFEVEDHGSGIPLLLLHGFPLSSAAWDPLRPTLAEVARLVTPDLRGFGGSDKPVGGYGMSELAEDAAALAEALGLERFILGGHSMGGYVALRLAETLAGRLAGLILIDTRADADSAEALARRDAALATIARDGGARYLDGFVPNLLSPSTRERAPRLLAELRAIAAAVPDHVLAGCQRGMRERPDSSGLLPRLDVPALVLVGGEDAITPPDVARAMASALPQATLAVIPGAGHTPSVERPIPTAEALAGFVRRHF
jgi:pimeloyl-ACP methyl ester carboxylesterase